MSATRSDLLAAGLAGAALGLGAGLASRPRRTATATALITGGSRGFGLLLAREYLRRGARVAICARDEKELARATEELAGTGAPVLAVPCDVRDASAVRELVETTAQHFGRLDTVVHNAGVIQVGPAANMTLADYEDALRVHLFGALNLVGAALPRLLSQRSGRIVTVASIAGLVPFPHLLPYATSKAALVAWSEGLRAELAGTGISVTTVCPALMRTGSPRHALFKGRHREEYAWFSIAASLPGLSIGAARAARRVVRAAERGAARVVVPAQGRLAIAMHAASPALTLSALGAIRRMLPDPGGIGPRSVLGSDSESGWSPSFLTALNERAAARNNELSEGSAHGLLR